MEIMNTTRTMVMLPAIITMCHLLFSFSEFEAWSASNVGSVSCAVWRLVASVDSV